MIGAAISAAISFVWQALGLRGVLIVAAMVGVVAAYFVVLERGGDRREAEIAEDNRRAEEAAAATGTRVDRCFARGGEWNTVTGRCVLAPVAPVVPPRRPDSP